MRDTLADGSGLSSAACRDNVVYVHSTTVVAVTSAILLRHFLRGGRSNQNQIWRGNMLRGINGFWIHRGFLQHMPTRNSVWVITTLCSYVRGGIFPTEPNQHDNTR